MNKLNKKPEVFGLYAMVDTDRGKRLFKAINRFQSRIYMEPPLPCDEKIHEEFAEVIEVYMFGSLRNIKASDCELVKKEND